MTGAELKQLREDLGEAIGRPLSVGDMATLCGLPPETGPATIVKWEAGAGPNGPVAALLSLIAVGCDRYPLGEEIISAGDAELFRAMMRAGIIRRLSPTGAGFRSRDPGPPDSFEHVVHGLCQIVTSGELGALLAHIGFQIGNQRRALRLADSLSVVKALAIDRALDGEECVDAAHDLDRNRRGLSPSCQQPYVARFPRDPISFTCAGISTLRKEADN